MPLCSPLSQIGAMTRATTLTQPKVGIVSLGCPKALVDSERIITRLRAEGYQIAPDYKGADLVLVNTCGSSTAPARKASTP
jgi:ribosomal protein S12 methylthiotransferase